MLTQFFKSFHYAWLGIRVAWKEGNNFKIQLACAGMALWLGASVRLSGLEFAVIIAAIGLVITAEIFNTALEELCDKFQPTHDPHIAKIKDLSAAAVLVTATVATAIGIAIFIPHLW